MVIMRCFFDTLNEVRLLNIIGSSIGVMLIFTLLLDTILLIIDKQQELEV